MNSELIKLYGVAALAKKLGLSFQTVNNWIARGVPLEQAVEFCKAVDYSVTPHQLYPRNYPHPHDGLPEHLRVAA